MSGICGIVEFSGQDPSVEDIAALTAPLAFRGPDYTRHWLSSRVALGHCSLATTPEAALELQPLVHASSGCSITCDARLDNRETLAEQLGLNLESRNIGDAEMILAAYLRWGRGAAERLLGDFAFAIWDAREERLFAARDQLGMKQFIYGAPKPFRFLFASTPSVIRNSAREDFPVNMARVADFLEDLEGIDQEVTFFEKIFRLPPGHHLVFDRTGLSISRYWTLEAPEELVLPSNADYAEAFLQVFSGAVRSRLRSAGPIASMLSGGVDSAAVTSLAAEILSEQGGGQLRTFSVIGSDKKASGETCRILQASSMPGVSSHLIDLTNAGELFADLWQGLARLEEPFDGTMTLIRAVYSAAAKENFRVVLDGVASDVVLSHGDVHRHFAERGQWRRLLADARSYREIWNFGPSPWRAAIGGAWRAYAPENAQLAKRELARRLRRDAVPPPSLCGSALAERVDLAERRLRASSAPRGATGSRADRLASVLHPNLTVGRERYDRVAAAAGIEPRDPFMDLRVVRFCLSLPVDQLRDQGWPKLLLRRAMAGRLPDMSRWCHPREHHGWACSQRLFEGWSGWSEDDIDALASLGCDGDALTAITQGWRGVLETDEQASLAYLSKWSRSCMM